MPAENSSAAAFHHSASHVLARVRPVFRVVATTIVPEAARMEEPAWLETEQLIIAALTRRSVSEQRQLRLFLRVVQWLPVFRYGRRFTSLDPARRRRFLCYLQDHPVLLIRTGFWGLRTLALLGYYGRTEAAKEIGYTPDARGWGVEG